MMDARCSALTGIGMLARCLPDGGQADIHVMRDAAVGWQDGRIAWVGAQKDLPAKFRDGSVIDAGGRLVVPGLIDCHTHLAFGGWRADEFVSRIQGATYLDIAAGGGGIQSTVEATRRLDARQLADRADGFLSQMLELGVTTVEAKSGYGLETDTEIRQLEAYRELATRSPARIVATVLAHTIPPEYADRREEYVSWVCDTLLPVVGERGLATFADVFVETSAFSLQEGFKILTRASELGFALKIHADQLSDSGATAMAARLGATSADHLEFVSQEGIAAMRDNGTVAVSLPLATAYLKANPLPARSLIAAGVPVAVATDFNPGSAPSFHLPLAMTLACLLQDMTPSEVLKGVTSIAARALQVDDQTGSISEGMAADLVVLDADSVDQWLYHMQPNAASTVIRDGHVVAP